MSVVARIAAGAALVAALGGQAAAQEPGADRFFFVAEEQDERDKTAYDGSLTSTSFYYGEFGSAGDPINQIDPNAPGLNNASPIDRIFTDLRAQLDAKHISGSKVDFRADMRGRLTTTYLEAQTTNIDAEGNPDKSEIPYQTGQFHGNEGEVRELYLMRRGSEFDVGIGRQYSLELAATKFDGLKVERKNSKVWKTIAFAGAYPWRGSRDIRDDYPTDPDNDPDTDGNQPKRIIPLAGGLGTAYRYERAYGAFGVVGIFPLANDDETGTLEKPRVFATANGYWRQSATVDIYHYTVVDATGAAGAGLTNLTLGANWQPAAALRIYGQASHIDTETLNVQAQLKLDNPDGVGAAVIQNNIEVSRIAQDSARVGVSGSIKQRFEISTSGTIRRRPELVVSTSNGMDEVIFPKAQAVDITLGVVDRKSYKDMRIGLSGTRTFGVGNATLYRSKSTVVRADATKSLKDGRAEVVGDVTVVASSDDNIGTVCDMTQLDTCFGASKMLSLGGGLLGFYRFKPDWFVIGSGSIARQVLTTTVSTGMTIAQQPIYTAALLLRLAYRF